MNLMGCLELGIASLFDVAWYVGTAGSKQWSPWSLRHDVA